MVDWVGAQWVQPNEVHLHWLCFSNLSNLLGKGLLVKKLSCLWVCINWVLWKWRNAVLFDAKLDWDFRRIKVEIKCRFWSWIVVRGEVDANITYPSWDNTRLCDIWL